MKPVTLGPLANWQNFYVIVGSAAGALTGLQFVVMTLLTQAKARPSVREIRAFGSPTVVHFCTALLVAALAVAPWPSLVDFGFCLGACGAAGLLYSLSIFWHARKASYEPDWEDWIWYAALPCVCHLLLVAISMLLWQSALWSLFLVAADSLLFLLLGIHNSWDTVTYIAIKQGGQRADEREAGNEAK